MCTMPGQTSAHLLQKRQQVSPLGARTNRRLNRLGRGLGNQYRRKLTSTLSCTAVGKPFLSAGLNFHVETASTAFASRSSPKHLTTRILCTSPSAPTTIHKLTVP